MADLLEITSRANIEASGLTTFAEHEPRIFERGKDAANSQIGTYSTEPMYVSPKNTPRKLSGKGKTGAAKFRDGRRHVSRYFPGGYREFRAAVGRESSFVNLELFGDMRKSYIPGWRGDRFAFGFITKAEADKAEKNERHFKKEIFALTDGEIDMFIDTLMLPLE